MQRSSQGTASRARLNCARFHLATFHRGRLSIPRNTGFPLLEAEQTPPLHFPRVSVQRINENALVPRGKKRRSTFRRNRNAPSSFYFIPYLLSYYIGNELNNNIVNFFHAQQLSSRGRGERKKKPIDLLCAFPTEINIYFHFFGGGRNRSMR